MVQALIDVVWKKQGSGVSAMRLPIKQSASNIQVVSKGAIVSAVMGHLHGMLYLKGY